MEVQSKKVASVFTCKKPLIIKELRQFFLASFNKIYAFSLSTAEILHCLKGHEAKVIAIRKNPYNKKSIISCDTSGTVISWAHQGNVEDNKLFCLHGSKKITFFDVLEDGSFLIGFNGNLSIFSSLEEDGSLLIKKVKCGCKQIAKNRSIICGIQSNHIFVTQYPKNARWHTQRHNIKYNATCIACHPHEEILAVGGERGIISIYKDVCSSNPIITNHHWHFLPVGDLCFNNAGNELYSGGGEAVLMKWKLSSNSKKPMPRLGMAIDYITVDDEETVITHVDNDITIYQGEVITPVKGDSFIVSSETCDGEVFFHHAPTNLLITHGWPGYLQFYSVETNRRKFQLDIALENFLPSEKNKQSTSQIVHAAAISEGGTWIVTYDRCSFSNSWDVYTLKFWSYSLFSRKWLLNSSETTAHSDKITSLTLSKELSCDFYCISCSNDRTAKVWATYQTGKRKTHVNWKSHAVKVFRNLTPRASAFHPDASLMAVAFADCINIYKNDEDMSQMYTLRNEEDEDIIELQFTAEQYGPLLLARSMKSLTVWNLANQDCSSLDIDSRCMAINPSTGIVALFKRNESSVCLLKIKEDFDSSLFEINIHKEFKIHEDLSVNAALWVPYSNKHVLHFKTNFQEVYKIDEKAEEEEADNIIVATENHIDTPFSRLLSTTRTKIFENQKDNTEYVPSIKNWREQEPYATYNLEKDCFDELIYSLKNMVLPDH